MKIAIVTDAWRPQVNGVVTTLTELRGALLARGHSLALVEPSQFRRFPMPGYGEIELAWQPARQMTRLLSEANPDAIHIATEGPLGSAARSFCLARNLRFTTAFHTRFPEFIAAATGLPAAIGYAWLRRFHRPSSGVMVPSQSTKSILEGRGFANLRPWSHGVDLTRFRPLRPHVMQLPRPIFLYVGRISPEKNVEAFLRLDLPGSKVVCGGGPLLERFKRTYPEVQWRGVVPRDDLPSIYSAADSFVFPSRTDTFGLVMLEALAAGLRSLRTRPRGPST